MKGLRLFAFFFFITLFAQAQKVELRGYVKEMNIFNFIGEDSLITDNFIHNRLNLHSSLHKNFDAHIELRNRIFYGETVRLNPFYKDAIDVDPGYLDLSFIWLEHNAAFAHSIVDRAWLEYRNQNLEIRLGRQRINWGINTVWNPNDIFNAFNFIDFDYEERPGNDALRAQYYFKNASKLEFAYAPGRNHDEHIGAFLYQFNFRSYDIQLIQGIYRNDFISGLGWAGNLGNAGFKGEASYFIDRYNYFDTTNAFSATFALDYSFRKGTYMMISGLYNSIGFENLNNLALNGTLAGGEFSAKNLMITKYSGFYQISHPVSPLFQPSLAVIYGFGANLIFLMPGIQYSIAENWDINLIGQMYLIELNNTLQNPANSLFLRLKWSF